MQVKIQLSSTPTLRPFEKDADAHWIGVWVGSTDGHDASCQELNHDSCIVQPVGWSL